MRPFLFNNEKFATDLQSAPKSILYQLVGRNVGFTSQPTVLIWHARPGK
jgi:hypothetical protein